jgi:hypothetical protein
MALTETTIVTDESGAEIERREREQYTLLELKQSDPRGYDRALEKLAMSALEYDWWDAVLDAMVEIIAEKYGITYDPKDVSFDLDRGSMFVFGKASVDDRKLLKRAGLDLRSKDARTILDHGLVMGTTHYGGGYEGGWIGLAGGYEDIPEWTCSAETADAIRDVLRDAQNEMLSTLRAEQEYLTSAEYLEEHAEINEMRFYENGSVAR